MRKILKNFQGLYLKILGPRHHVPVAIGLTKVALHDPSANSKAVTNEHLGHPGTRESTPPLLHGATPRGYLTRRLGSAAPPRVALLDASPRKVLRRHASRCLTRRLGKCCAA